MEVTHKSSRFVPRLIHGAACGAAICALLGMIEAGLLLIDHEYHRDFGLLSRVLWPNIKLGAILGLLAAVSAPLFSTRKDRKFPGLQIGLLVFGLLAALQLGLHLNSDWPQRSMWAFLLMLVIQQTARLLATTRLGWMTAPFFTPLANGCTLLICVLLSGVAWFIPEFSALQASTKKLSIEAAHKLQVELDQVIHHQAKAPQHLLVFNLLNGDSARFGYSGYARSTTPGIDLLANEGVIVRELKSAETQRLNFGKLALQLNANGWQTQAISFGGGTGTNLSAIANCFRRFNLLDNLSMQNGTMAARVWRKLSGLPRPKASREQLVNHQLRPFNAAQAKQRRLFSYIDLSHALEPLSPPDQLANQFMPEGLNAQSAFSTPANVEAQRSLQDAEFLAMDQVIASVVAALSDADFLEDTLVVICGSQVSNGDFATPLVMRNPRKLSAAKVISIPGASANDLPSFLLNLITE